MARATRDFSTKSRWLTTLGVSLLAVLTVVLVLAALRSTRPVVEAAGSTPGYVEAPQSATEPEQEPEEDLEPQDQAPYQVPPLGRIIAASDDQTAYRAQSGPCPATPANLEVTRDGGATWNSVNAGESLSGISRILARTDGYVLAVAQLNSNCDQTVVSQSYGFGDYWEIAEGGELSTWYVHAENTETVNAPDVGPVAAPCPVARLTSLSAGAALVLCEDGTLAVTGDSGMTWSRSEVFPGAQSITVSGETFLLAQTGLDSCDGTQVSRLANGVTIESSVCVPATGEAAIAGSSTDAVWLWAGDAVLRSPDGGITWQ